MRKRVTLPLIVLFAVSSIMVVKPTFAQSIPSPIFSIDTASGSNVTPTTYSIDPYTGANITNPGYTVITFNVTLTIQNNPLTSAYLLEVKGHYASNWYDPMIDNYNITAFASSGSQTVITLYGSNDTEAIANEIFLQYDGHWGIDVPFGGQLDFRLQSVSGNIGARVFGGWIYVGNVSDWSAVQTINIPNFSSSASPTPAVPEFTSLTILPLLIIVLISVGLAVYFKKRKR